MTQLTVFLRHAKRSNTKDLDLSQRQLQFIPKQVFTIPGIQILNISKNKISNIQSDIFNLKNLHTLNCQSNLLTELPYQILQIKKLKKLNINDNPLRNGFQKLLDQKNQSTPYLQEILNQCLANKPRLNKNNQTPSWLMEPTDLNLEKQQDIKKQTISTINFNKQSQINWDDSIFKKQNKSKRSFLNKNISGNISLNHRNKSLIDCKPQNKSNQGVLQIQIKQLQIGQQISMGGFSTIHKGQYFGLQVAVKKIFNPNINQDLMKEFNNQLIMLSKYRHPNIVLLLGAVTTPPTLCIVMEYIKNGTLYQILHQKKIDLNEKIRRKIVKQILSVLKYLHSHGVVHRDIKPHNFLINDDWNVKMCDFGLARHKSQLNTGPMQFSGTPAYMSQQLFLKKGYDQTVDIFALGTMLYEIYSGQIPFSGLDPSAIKDKVMSNPNMANFKIKKSILQLINKCRAEDPKERPSIQQLSYFEQW